MQQWRNVFPLLGLLVIILSACGSAPVNNVASVLSDDTKSDRVVIEQLSLNEKEKPLKVEVTDQEEVRSLYELINGLPAYPTDAICTMELGPTFKLTFWDGETQVTSVSAESYGCRAVTIGDDDKRQGSNSPLWDKINAYYVAQAEPVHPERYAVARIEQPEEPASYAGNTNAEQVQTFYDAIINLPLASENQSCFDDSGLGDKLVFFEKDLRVDVQPSRKCNIVNIYGIYNVDNPYRVPSGLREADEEFWKLYDETINKLTFSDARPDVLIASSADTGSKDTSELKSDASIVELYHEIFTLSASTQKLECATTQSKEYYLTFEQDGIILLSLCASPEKNTVVLTSFSPYITFNTTPRFWELFDTTIER